jgi:GNAT superfamily N-acetyltransferase
MVMVRELAEFEELSDQVFCTEADLTAALFGPEAVVHDLLAIADDGAVAGHALWFRTFSTFLGKTGIWLEDIYIRPAYRRQGLAGALLRDLRGRTDGRVEWEVLEWNNVAIDFYQGLGARPMAGWTKYRWLDGA